MSSSTTTSGTTTSSTSTSTTTTFQTGVQYGFFFDQSRCYNCRVCTVACMEWYNLAPTTLTGSTMKYARMFEWETGSFPNIRMNYLFAPCYHCANPVCVAAANGAMMKEPKYGAVLIDPGQANSASLRAAWNACPYGAISFDSDSPTASASKCTMCIDRLEQGLYPICVQACPARALDFDTMDNLKIKYGTNQQLDEMPDPGTTNPSVVFNPHSAKTQLVPYDATEALTLLATRAPYAPVYSNPDQVTTIPQGVVKRTSLVMKPSSAADFMSYTMTDEG